MFYLSVHAAVPAAGLDPLAGSLALAAIHIGEGLVWFALLVVLAVNRARGWLTRPAVRRRLEQLTGVAFLGFGLRLALDRGPRGCAVDCPDLPVERSRRRSDAGATARPRRNRRLSA